MENKTNYNDIIERIEKLGINDYFQFENQPGSEFFEEIFPFYQGSLEKNYSHYNIKPSAIYFKNSHYNDINAKATKSKNNYIIAINKGVIAFHKKHFFDNYDLFNQPGLEQYSKISEAIEPSLNVLIYQANTLFTFYHEFGHLVQFSKMQEKEKSLNEQCHDNVEYSLERHIMEIDADTFSTLYVSGHIFQFINNYLDSNPSDENLEIISSAICSGLLIYLTSFCSFDYAFYLRQEAHPHPVVRIKNIITVFTKSFSNILEIKGISARINPTKIEKLVFQITPLLHSKIFLKCKSDDYQNIFSENQSEIEEYLLEINKAIFKDENSALSQRNEISKRNY